MISLFLLTNKPDFSIKEQRMLDSRCKLKERSVFSLFCEEPKQKNNHILFFPLVIFLFKIIFHCFLSRLIWAVR